MSRISQQIMGWTVFFPHPRLKVPNILVFWVLTVTGWWAFQSQYLLPRILWFVLHHYFNFGLLSSVLFYFWNFGLIDFFKAAFPQLCTLKAAFWNDRILASRPIPTKSWVFSFKKRSSRVHEGNMGNSVCLSVGFLTVNCKIKIKGKLCFCCPFIYLWMNFRACVKTRTYWGHSDGIIGSVANSPGENALTLYRGWMCGYWQIKLFMASR